MCLHLGGRNEEEWKNENFQNMNILGLHNNRAETEIGSLYFEIPHIFPRLTADILMGLAGNFGEMSLQRWVIEYI